MKNIVFSKLYTCRYAFMPQYISFPIHTYVFIKVNNKILIIILIEKNLTSRIYETFFSQTSHNNENITL